ncbi:M50 family metallopeptidase [Methanocella sp. MCL-LM]|uniref:M50 family metallopeptidase n=1 Tax=Methanocella sp. MCL-LM TaxID=3412035 RepID=UPI003C711402
MRTILAVLVALALGLIAVTDVATGEYYGIPQQIFKLDIKEVALDFGLSHNEKVLAVNLSPVTTLNPSLVLMGSGVDRYERAWFENYTYTNPVYPKYILKDDARSIGGSSIDEFDLLVVGGPKHNAYAKELLDRGVIHNVTPGEKMPAVVIQSATTQKGHQIVVVGSVAGYPGYVDEEPPAQAKPDDTLPLAVVTTGTILSILGVYLSQLYSQVFSFIYGYVTTLAGEVASEKEAEIRHLKAHKVKKALLFGWSWQELTIATSCIILFAIAYIIADRMAMLPENIAIYIIVAGFVVIAHDVGHRIVAFLLKVDAEFQFWGLGAITMLLTSWLFSMVFAQPSRVLIEKEEHNANEIASIMLAGPAVSLFLSLAFLLLMMVGGAVAELGALGFTMNMVTVVYSLMPFNPMDGKSIYEWNRRYWAILFIPISILFIVVTWFGIFTWG